MTGEQDTWERKHTTQRKWQTLDVVSYNWPIERANFELEPQRKKQRQKDSNYLSIKKMALPQRVHWVQVILRSKHLLFTKKGSVAPV